MSLGLLSTISRYSVRALAFCLCLPLNLWAQNTVRLYEQQEPDGLNPLTSNTASAEYVQNLLFVSLLEYEPESFVLRPVAAVARPELRFNSDSTVLYLDYELRPEAVWDNGKPITWEDYLFTLKLVFVPGIKATDVRSFCHFIEEVIPDSKNPKRFSLRCSPHFLAESGSGTLPLLPKYRYDRKGVLNKISLSQLKDPAKQDSLAKLKSLQSFAQTFNEQHSINPKMIEGAGPYRLRSWVRGQEMVLERKKNWWGERCSESYFGVFPTLITYLYEGNVKDLIEERKIDLAYNIPHRYFVDIINSEARNYYNFHTPAQLNYHYIGFNNQRKPLDDWRLRRALAHLVDRDRWMQQLFGGLAIKVNGPIHPTKAQSYRYLPDIRPNATRATQLLNQAGWTQAEAQAPLKNASGEVLELEFIYIETHDYRRLMGERLAAEAANLGIKINVKGLDSKTYYARLNNRDYDLFAAAWALDPGPDNLRQLWHSEADKVDGSNYIGFRHPKVDALIEELEKCLQPERQMAIYQEIQEIIYEAQPCVFLFSNSGHIAIHWRFDEVKISLLRPGFKVQRFKEKKEDK